jgi:hypothetical protein
MESETWGDENDNKKLTRKDISSGEDTSCEVSERK